MSQLGLGNVAFKLGDIISHVIASVQRLSRCSCRQYVISQIPGLEILDDTEVLEKERSQARKIYPLAQRRSGRKRRERSACQDP